MNDQFDKEEIRAMVTEAAKELTLKEKITLWLIGFLSVTAGIAFLLLAYTLAKHANIF